MDPWIPQMESEGESSSYSPTPSADSRLPCKASVTTRRALLVIVRVLRVLVVVVSCGKRACNVRQLPVAIVVAIQQPPYTYLREPYDP
jgi:hypothetical protein